MYEGGVLCTGFDVTTVRLQVGAHAQVVHPFLYYTRGEREGASESVYLLKPLS